ncbi:hypothetical protein BJX70DRAFT_356343 [Aspergillus crustosus]
MQETSTLIWSTSIYFLFLYHYSAPMTSAPRRLNWAPRWLSPWLVAAAGLESGKCGVGDGVRRRCGIIWSMYSDVRKVS